MTPRWAWVAIVVGSAMVVVGAMRGGREADVDVGTVPPVEPVSAASAAPPERSIAPRASASASASAQSGPPVRLRIPKQRVDAPVVAVEVSSGGELGVPDDPDVVGWWNAGAPAGGSVGSVVLDGHVDSWDRGPGALFRLTQLRPGDSVQLVVRVGGADRTVDYTIAAVRAYAKADLPNEIFDRAGAPRLVLISCGGPFDQAHRSYRDNIVVYGVPSGWR